MSKYIKLTIYSLTEQEGYIMGFFGLSEKDFFSTLRQCENMLGATYISYSQNSEDLILERLLLEDSRPMDNQPLLYCDVGAHHPIRFSNTFRLYLQGWSGINIDPLPKCMDEFNKSRPEDINLSLGISDKNGFLKYYCFEEPAYNTTNEERAKLVKEMKWSRLIEEIDVPVYTLKYIFDLYLGNRKITLLNIDVETRELSVLKSNDWDKYRPRYVVMESLEQYLLPISKLYEDKNVGYLIERGYEPLMKSGNAVFLKDQLE